MELGTSSGCWSLGLEWMWVGVGLWPSLNRNVKVSR